MWERSERQKIKRDAEWKKQSRLATRWIHYYSWEEEGLQVNYHHERLRHGDHCQAHQKVVTTTTEGHRDYYRLTTSQHTVTHYDKSSTTTTLMTKVETATACGVETTSLHAHCHNVAWWLQQVTTETMEATTRPTRGPCNYNDDNDYNQRERGNESTGHCGHYHDRNHDHKIIVCDNHYYHTQEEERLTTTRNMTGQGEGTTTTMRTKKTVWLRSCRIDYRRGTDDERELRRRLNEPSGYWTDFRCYFSYFLHCFFMALAEKREGPKPPQKLAFRWFLSFNWHRQFLVLAKQKPVLGCAPDLRTKPWQFFVTLFLCPETTTEIGFSEVSRGKRRVKITTWKHYKIGVSRVSCCLFYMLWFRKLCFSASVHQKKVLLKLFSFLHFQWTHPEGQRHTN